MLGDRCAIGGAVGAAVVLTLLFSEDSPTTATHVGEAILIAVGALSTLAAIGLFVLAFQEVPRLRIGEPVAEARQNPAHHVVNTPLERTSGAPVSPPSFVTPSSGPDGAQQALDVAQLHVRNVPKRGSSRARGVYVRLNFHDSTTGASVQSVWARWSDAPSGDVPGADISSLRRWTFPEMATVSGSMSLPYSTTTSNAMRWTQTRKPQGGEPYRSDLIPWSMSLLAVRTQRADSAWYEVIHGGRVARSGSPRPIVRAGKPPSRSIVGIDERHLQRPPPRRRSSQFSNYSGTAGSSSQ